MSYQCMMNFRYIFLVILAALPMPVPNQEVNITALNEGLDAVRELALVDSAKVNNVLEVCRTKGDVGDTDTLLLCFLFIEALHDKLGEFFNETRDYMTKILLD